MDDSRWGRIQAVFHAASEVTAAPERERLLLEACGSDSDLLAEVRSLLDHSAESSGFVAGHVAGELHLMTSADSASEVRRAGPYVLTRELGRGGMGIVYLGNRADGEYTGEAAIKVLRPGLDTDFFLARFKREKQALARLQHPNIARMLDSGTTGTGLPYIVMERIEGVSIVEYARERKLSIEQILQLYLPVCFAVAHAHAQSIVHRDIKPGNILVDASGVPKLLDFGICKQLDDRAGGETMTGAALMTPAYASPEQTRGESATPASDIYSLGAVLFELVEGQAPHKADRRPGDSQSTTAGLTTGSAAAKRWRRRLDPIFEKALAIDPSQRFASVEEFRSQLQRALDGAPGPLASPVRMRRFWYAAAFLVLAAGGAGMWITRQSSRDRAESLRKQADSLRATYTYASLEQAQALLERATALDASNPDGYASLANTYVALSSLNATRRAELGPKALAAANRAVALAPRSTHVRLAQILYYRDLALDYRAASSACQQTIQEVERADRFLGICVFLQSVMGNHEIAALWADRLVADMPKDPFSFLAKGVAHYRAEQYEAAETALRQSLSFRSNPNRIVCFVYLALAKSMQNRPAEALAMLDQETPYRASNRIELFAARAFAAGRAGQREEAVKMRALIQKHVEQDSATPIYLAYADLGMGNRDGVLQSVEMAASRRDDMLADFIADPASAALRGHARFQAVIKSFGLTHFLE